MMVFNGGRAGCCSLLVPEPTLSVVDLDPTFHFHADPDPDPACHLDPDPTLHFDADPDPDPRFQINAQNLEKVLK